MNQLTIKIIILIGLLLPFSAFAASDGEVTIRVMQLGESSSDSVMNRIELPEMESDRASEHSRQGADDSLRQQQQVRGSEHNFDQDPQMEQLQEMQQEHHEFENERDNQAPGNQQPGGNQNGPGSGK